jgi:hypothetical protein
VLSDEFTRGLVRQFGDQPREIFRRDQLLERVVQSGVHDQSTFALHLGTGRMPMFLYVTQEWQAEREQPLDCGLRS